MTLAVPLVLAGVATAAAILGQRAGPVATLAAGGLLLVWRASIVGELEWRDAVGASLFMLTALILVALASRTEAAKAPVSVRQRAAHAPTWLYVASLIEFAIAVDILQEAWSDSEHMTLAIPVALVMVAAAATIFGAACGVRRDAGGRGFLLAGGQASSAGSIGTTRSARPSSWGQH